MTFQYLLLAQLGLVLAAQIIHILVWRLARPGKYLLWFALYWLVLPLLVVIAVQLMWPLLQQRAIVWDAALFWLAVYAGAVAVLSAYVMLFPAISATSPSLTLLWHLLRSPDRKAALREIEQAATSSRLLIARRISNEVENGFLLEKDGRLSLAPHGKRTARLIGFCRRLWSISDEVAG